VTAEFQFNLARVRHRAGYVSIYEHTPGIVRPVIYAFYKAILFYPILKSLENHP
jgi:hypothetical protein